MSKRLLVVAVLAVLVVALGATSAFAESYNDGVGNAGFYTRDAGYFSGPHGGYTTTTNKCQDCHSTHYATGSFKLLRANSREAACDYCHGGGGGSTINIQMDNDYHSGAYTQDTASAVETTTMGFGTGHTLGYEGNAPADIQPAYSDAEGLACFDCHSPHGNSARVLDAFGSPSHPAGEGLVEEVVGVSFMATQFFRIQEQMMVEFDFGDFNAFTGQSYPQGTYMNIPEDLTQLPHDFDGSAISKWTGPAQEIGSVIQGDATMMSEIGAAGTNFGAWMTAGGTPKAPLPADMMTWAMTPANFAGDADGDGYREVSNAGVGALMALFTDNGASMDLVNLFMSWKVYWGEDVDGGNITTAFLNMGDWQVQGGSYAPIANPELEVWHKPLFPKGRFLLLKNPDNRDDYTVAEGGVNEFGMPSPDMLTTDTAQANAANGKKVAIDWEWPLGPAATWGPFFYTDTDERFPLAFPWAPKGVAMENEFCASCHDGTVGLATQEALVWKPNAVDSSTGAYQVAYSHDANARGCARAQYLNSDDDNNFGPHCANCHTGASACQTCHSEEGDNWESFLRDAFDPHNATMTGYEETTTIFVEGETGYRAPASLRHSAVANVNGQCLDGGFSYPHRTLGANMLKDALWGIDFDGDPIAFGEARTGQAAVEGVYGADYFQSFFDTPVSTVEGQLVGSFEATTLAGAETENLDSVCIDCHGDATYWNGDDSTYKADFISGNPLDDPADGMQMWDIEGWNLMLKGLP